MSRTTVATLVSLPLAAAVAWTLGGREGTGVFAGFLLAAAIVGGGHAWEVGVLRKKPRQALAVRVQTFLVQLFAMLGAVLVLRFVEPVAQRVEWSTFLLAYATTVLIALVPGSLDAARLLKESRAL